MLKPIIFIVLSCSLASAWFMPKMEFGYSNDEKHQNVDKSYVRDNQKEVVINSNNSKMYYDATPLEKMHFFKAWDYCQNFKYLGYENWRVPSKKEMRDLLELSRRDLTIKHAFKNVQPELYWTSTDSKYEEAYYVDFDLGRYSTAKQKNKYRVMCVRDSK